MHSATIIVTSGQRYLTTSIIQSQKLDRTVLDHKLDGTVLGRFSKRESRCSMQFIFGDHFDHVLAFGDGKRRNGM